MHVATGTPRAAGTGSCPNVNPSLRSRCLLACASFVSHQRLSIRVYFLINGALSLADLGLPLRDRNTGEMRQNEVAK